MSKKKSFGPHPKGSYTYQELPIGSTSIGVHTDMIKTGQWRLMRPLFTTKTAPCSEACPAGVDVRGFISLMKQKLFEEARQLYLEENPFPAVCGRVCYYPCENACNRRDFDQAVSINALEQFIGDFHSQPPQDRSKKGGKIAVVGSGPAGLSCAYYLARMGHKAVVFETLNTLGGLLRTGIPSFRLSNTIVDNEVQKLRALGIHFKTGHRITKENWKDLEEFDAIFLAHGAYTDLPFIQACEENQGIISGIEFLRTVNLGEEIYLGKRVVVVGGGNTALDAARVALRLKANPTIIYRRSQDEMPAFRCEVEAAQAEGVEILYLTSPISFARRRSTLKIDCIKNQLGEPDADGRRRPLSVKGSNFSIEADTIISATGTAPDLSFIPQDLKSSTQSVHVDNLCSTNRPGIFAGGDLIDQPRTVAHAIGSGKKAAVAMDCYLRNEQIQGLHDNLQIGEKGSLSFQRYLEKNLIQESKEVVLFNDLNSSYFKAKKRAEKPKIPQRRRSGFDEIHGTLSSEKAQEEAERCFSCGKCNLCDNCYIFCPDSSVLLKKDDPGNEFDYEYCKGCGICENECPVGVIDMEKEA